MISYAVSNLKITEDLVTFNVRLKEIIDSCQMMLNDLIYYSFACVYLIVFKDSDLIIDRDSLIKFTEHAERNLLTLQSSTDST